MAARDRVTLEDGPGHGAPVRVLRHDDMRLDAPHAGAGARCRPVTHDHMAIAFYTGGGATFELQGRWSLEAGDAVVIPAGAPHRLLEKRDPRLWALGFCPVCFIAEGAAELLEVFERVRAGGAAVVHIPAERHAYLESLFSELRREIQRPDGPLSRVQSSLVTLIVAEVARASSTAVRSPSASSPVADALRFIERNCLSPISLDDVARAVGRSPAHLTTLVRRATGRSVQAWIIAGRLSEARRRLSHTDEMVEVIAERVGYADATHFIRLFRREHGMTPSAWRARHRPAGRQ